MMHGKDVRLKSLSVAFADTIALHPIDLAIEAGEFVSVLGPSGAGKTTLLRAVAGHLAPALGRILVGDVDLTDLGPEHRPTAMVFQSLALFPRMSVADNVAFGLEARGVDRATRRARAEELLDLVGLAGAGARAPADLCTGDGRRVAVARALAVDPAVLLLDEPLAGLDLDQRRRLRRDLTAIRQRTGVTVLHVTHDAGEALALSDRVAVLNAGRLEQVDTPDLVYARPATRFVAGFVGEQNRLAGHVVEVLRDRVAVATALGRILATPRAPLAAGDAVEVMIRPERLSLAAERVERGPPGSDVDGWNDLRGDLVGRSLDGATVAHEVAVGDTRLVMHRPNLGLHDLLLPSLHAIGFHADDALAFPLPAATEAAP